MTNYVDMLVMQQKWHNGAGVQANGSIMCRHLWRVNRLFNMHRLDKNNVMPEKEIMANSCINKW